MPEEIAQAAGWPIRKADEFVNGMVYAGFLNQDSEGYHFHNWSRYTWRFYDSKERKDNASESGSFGNHKRWHVTRGEVSPDCEFCRVANRGDGRGDIATPSLPSSSSPSDPTQPTEPSLATRPTAPTGDRKAVAMKDHPLNFTDGEWAALMAGHPGRNVTALWREWVFWIEEEEEKRKPKDKYRAFEGWLKSKERHAAAVAN